MQEYTSFAFVIRLTIYLSTVQCSAFRFPFWSLYPFWHLINFAHFVQRFYERCVRMCALYYIHSPWHLFTFLYIFLSLSPFWFTLLFAYVDGIAFARVCVCAHWFLSKYHFSICSLCEFKWKEDKRKSLQMFNDTIAIKTFQKDIKCQSKDLQSLSLATPVDSVCKFVENDWRCHMKDYPLISANNVACCTKITRRQINVYLRGC